MESSTKDIGKTMRWTDLEDISIQMVTISLGNSEMQKRHGQGEYHFQEGAMFKGQYENGINNGSGEFHYPDGTVYVGMWKNGKKEGDGVMILPDGQQKLWLWNNHNFVALV